MEALVLKTVCHFFGDGVRFNKGTFLGGASCKEQIDGKCDNAKTKGAYPDIPLVLEDRVVIVEIDESRHQFYNESCELARYDTLQFGTKHLLPTKVFRFNPHDTSTIKLDFQAKLKVLIQRVRNYLTSTLEETIPVASVEWLYYGEGSKQKEFAKHASNTIRILPDINDLCEPLDEDIATFSLTNLGSLDAVVNDITNRNGLANGCAANSKELLKYISTAYTARDIDYMRDALGEETFNYWGISYGSYLGLTLVNMFPNRTGNVLIDGVTDPTTFSGRFIDWAKTNVADTEAVIDAFGRECATAGPTRCALANSNSSTSAISTQLREYISYLSDHPVVYTGSGLPFLIDGYFSGAALHSSWRRRQCLGRLPSMHIRNPKHLRRLSSNQMHRWSQRLPSLPRKNGNKPPSKLQESHPSPDAKWSTKV
ncbi:hypothetical protein HDV05_003696 [Chytridiales sp. JEL 0842]|nr:hypothetical protein HDV05_003696 [Chytridiales sp. JEL 0842]